MRAKVERFIREQEMIRAGGRVIAGVSGGADSVCLLHILVRIRREFGFSLRAVHVHHGLRGEEADRDAAFTKELCGRLGVPVRILRADVRGYAEEYAVSEEEAGRVLRYQTLEEEAARWEREEAGEPVSIAVAHHGDDSAETILHNLFRGSGLAGLGGIRPVRGRIIRPLLCVDKREIREYLRDQGLGFCEDSTNASGDYTRNRIRGRLIPAIESEVNRQAVEHIRQAGERIRQADEFIRTAAARWLEENGGLGPDRGETEQDGQPVSLWIPDSLRLEPEILQMYVLRRALETISPGRRDVTARHYRALSDLLGGPVGRKADLPGGIRAAREYRSLRLEAGDGERGKTGEERAPTLEFTVFPREKNSEIPKNMYTKWFDYDKIKNVLSVRTRRTGDYLTLAGGGRKSVKAYMIDEKIPAADRDSIYLLADGSHILWVIGYRVSEYYKIGPQTETILQVQMNGGER